MLTCSICREIRISEGSYDDYKALAMYHYRDSGPGPYSKIFALKPKQHSYLDVNIIGVIVYTLPNPGLELRNIATDNYFVGFDRSTQLKLLNKNIRRISRVIIEPRFRSLGLAARLVRETMLMMNFPIIEASAVMGAVNPFFEKAGMTAYTAPQKSSCVRMIEALNTVGIEESEFIEPVKVHRKIELLTIKKYNFVEREFNIFLKSYGSKRYGRPSLERTRYTLSRLTDRPTYYIWFNSDSGLAAQD